MPLFRALPHRLLLASAAALALLGVSPAARAQVSVERFQPAPGPRNFPTVETARVDGDMAFSFGLMADYANTPFRLRHCLPGPCAADGATVDRLDVIKNLVAANLLASLTPFPRLQLGLRVPVAYAAGQGVDTDPASATYGHATPGGVSGFTMGDPALEVKVRALGQAKSPVTAGVALSVSAPVGHAMAPELYFGDTSPVGELRAIVDADLGRFFFAANAGGALRSAEHLGSFDLGPEARFGAGAGMRITPPVRLMVQGFGSTNFTTAPGTSAAEADLAAQYAPDHSHVVVTLGGGAGLNQGVGVPLFRAFLGVGYEVERTRAAAPVDPDLDKDQIANEEDRCPREGGDVVRLPGRFYGCPKRDSDGDGVEDALDACPDKPGVVGKNAAENGCPATDRDADGIPNDKDKCPDKAENYNGFEDQDGCPDEPPVRVEIRNDQIVVINEHINFDFNSNQIVGARSFQALDLVAQALQQHPEIKKIEVAGYTDNVGSRETNMDYSRRRAAAVVTYLVSKGVDASRLVSVGYGPDKPVASNDTAEGRAENRRVQFNILMMFK